MNLFLFLLYCATPDPHHANLTKPQIPFSLISSLTYDFTFHSLLRCCHYATFDSPSISQSDIQQTSRTWRVIKCKSLDIWLMFVVIIFSNKVPSCIHDTTPCMDQINQRPGGIKKTMGNLIDTKNPSHSNLEENQLIFFSFHHSRDKS